MPRATTPLTHKCAFHHCHREEGTAQFQAMLVDFVRVENVDYDTALPRLQRDPRWEMAKHLSEGQLRRLFADHIAKVGHKSNPNPKRTFLTSSTPAVPRMTI